MNLLTDKNWKILKVIAQSTGYISTLELEKATGIKRRNIRDQIRPIRKFLELKGFELESVRSKGYRINIHYPHTASELEEILQNQTIITEETWQKASDRCQFAAVHLIHINDYILIDDLADVVNISRSTMAADINQTRLLLQKKMLDLESRSGKGIRAIGAESAKREFFLDFLFTKANSSGTVYKLLNNVFLDINSLEARVFHVLYEHGISFSDLSFFDFLMTLSFSLYRIAHHLYVREYEPIVPVEYMEAAKEIVLLIQEDLHILLPYEEIQFIAVQIVSKCSNPITNRNFAEQKQKILAKWKEILQSDYRLKTDLPAFADHLELHLETMLNHAAFKTKRRTTLFESAARFYIFGIQIAEDLAQVFQEETGWHPGQGDLASLAVLIHEQKFLTLNKSRPVILLGAEDTANARTLKFFLEKKHSYYISEVIWKSIGELPLLDLSPYAAVITTIPVSLNSKLPVIQISPTQTAKDHELVENTLALQAALTGLHFYALKPVMASPGMSITEISSLAAAEIEKLCQGVGADLLEKIQTGYLNDVFDFRNGVCVFSFINNLVKDSFFLPILIPEQKQILICISKRKSNSVLGKAVQKLFFSYTRTEIEEWFDNPKADFLDLVTLD